MGTIWTTPFCWLIKNVSILFIRNASGVFLTDFIFLAAVVNPLPEENVDEDAIIPLTQEKLLTSVDVADNVRIPDYPFADENVENAIILAAQEKPLTPFDVSDVDIFQLAGQARK